MCRLQRRPRAAICGRRILLECSTMPGFAGARLANRPDRSTLPPCPAVQGRSRRCGSERSPVRRPVQSVRRRRVDDRPMSAVARCSAAGRLLLAKPTMGRTPMPPVRRLGSGAADASRARSVLCETAVARSAPSRGHMTRMRQCALRCIAARLPGGCPAPIPSMVNDHAEHFLRIRELRKSPHHRTVRKRCLFEVIEHLWSMIAQ